MRLLIATGYLLLAGTAMAQQERMITVSAAPGLDVGYSGYYQGSHKLKHGISTGVGFFWRNTRWAYETGLLYTDRGAAFDQVPAESGPIGPDIVTDEKTYDIRSYRYLDVPFKANWYLKKNKESSYYFTAGASLNIFLGSKHVHHVTRSDGSSQTTTSYNTLDAGSLNFASLLGAGYEWRISEQWLFQAEALYRHQMLTVHKLWLLSFAPRFVVAYKVGTKK